MVFKYRPTVLDQLAGHGLEPGPETSPEFVREFLSDLYLVEIRLLKARLLSGEFPADQYSKRVAQLRDRYPLLGLPIRFWTGD